MTDESTPKHPGGAPTRYTPEVCDTIVQIMREGRFVAEVCAELGIHKDTFYQWVKKHPEFADSYKLGRVVCEAWWANQGRINLHNDKFNVKIWDRYMRTAFRDSWSDNYDPLEPGALDGYEGTPIAKSVVLDEALKNKKISIRQHKALMETLKIQIDMEDQEKLRKAVAALQG